MREEESFLHSIESSMSPELCEAGFDCGGVAVGENYVVLVCPKCLLNGRKALERHNNILYPTLLACQLCCEVGLAKHPAVCPTCKEKCTGAVQIVAKHPGWVIHELYENYFDEDEDYER